MTAQELLIDGDFEASAANGTFPDSGAWQPSWVEQSGAICVSEAGRSGHGLFAYTGEAGTNSWWAAPFQQFSAAPGAVYRAGAWLRSPPGQPWVPGTQARVHVAFLNAATNVLTSYESPSVATSNSAWAEFEVTTLAAPAETAFVRLVALLEKPKFLVGQSVVNFDDCSLHAASAAGVQVSSRALGLTAAQTQTDWQILNTGNAPLNWRVIEGLSWLSVDLTQGTLAPGEQQTIIVTINRAGLTGSEGIKGALTLETNAGDVPVDLYADMPSPAPPRLPARVSLHGRQLRVQDRLPDGTLSAAYHYVIKGAAWDPASRDTPDEFVRRRREFQKWHVADIQMMKAMNANTVYTFLDFGIGDSGAEVLDNLYKNGLKAIVTVDENGTANTNALQQVVTAYRDHPAVLAWAIGNEWNINLYHHRFTNEYDAALQTESMARLVKSLDSGHPVVSIHGDFDPAGMSNVVNALCPSVDIWGFNIYRGTSFGDRFQAWASFTDKPMFLSEYGTDAYRTYVFKLEPDFSITSADGAVDEQTQADFNRGLWFEIADNLSAQQLTNVCLGGTVFEWNDEWWKGQEMFGARVGRHDNLGFYTYWNELAHPDSFANEEWFALVAIDRQPRLSYFFYQEDFARVSPPADLDQDGLPDAWEYRIVDAADDDRFDRIGAVTPADDFDGDGSNNLQEYLAGTDPAHPASVLRFRRIALADAGVYLEWQAGTNAIQYLERTTALAPGGLWLPLLTNRPPTAATHSFVDAQSADATTRFYRLRIEHDP